MRQPKLNQKRALVWRALFTLALTAAGVYILVSHWHTVSQSLHAARNAHGPWIVFSIVLMVLTFYIAAGTYQVLALHRLRYTQTVVVELAAAFTNRLLPAGLGGLGLNGVYLYREKHTPVEATAIVSVNNLLGMCVHLMLLLGVLAFQPHVVASLFSRHDVPLSWVWVVGAVIVVLGCCSVPPARRKLADFMKNLLTSTRRLISVQLMWATILSLLLTVSYTCILVCAARAVGITLGILEMFIVFSFGVFVSTAVPTPGGLVGAEAALFAAFVAYGVPVTAAGAAVVVFRLVTYWLPLLPGVVALVSARSHRLV